MCVQQYQRNSSVWQGSAKCQDCQEITKTHLRDLQSAFQATRGKQCERLRWLFRRRGQEYGRSSRQSLRLRQKSWEVHQAKSFTKVWRASSITDRWIQRRFRLKIFFRPDFQTQKSPLLSDPIPSRPLKFLLWIGLRRTTHPTILTAADPSANATAAAFRTTNDFLTIGQFEHCSFWCDGSGLGHETISDPVWYEQSNF